MENLKEVTFNKNLFLDYKVDYKKITMYGLKIGDSIEKLNQFLLDNNISNFTQNRENEYVTIVKNKLNPKNNGLFKYENGIITGFSILIKELNLSVDNLRNKIGKEDKLTYGGDMFDDENPWYRDASDDIFIFNKMKVRFKKYCWEETFTSVHIGDYKTEEDE